MGYSTLFIQIFIVLKANLDQYRVVSLITCAYYRPNYVDKEVCVILLQNTHWNRVYADVVATLPKIKVILTTLWLSQLQNIGNFSLYEK